MTKKRAYEYKKWLSCELLELDETFRISSLDLWQHCVKIAAYLVDSTARGSLGPRQGAAIVPRDLRAKNAPKCL